MLQLLHNRSLQYHADDGKIFIGSGVGAHFGVSINKNLSWDHCGQTQSFKHAQRYSFRLSPGFEDNLSGNTPGWRADTIATYCSS